LLLGIAALVQRFDMELFNFSYEHDLKKIKMVHPVSQRWEQGNQSKTYTIVGVGPAELLFNKNTLTFPRVDNQT